MASTHFLLLGLVVTVSKYYYEVREHISAAQLLVMGVYSLSDAPPPASDNSVQDVHMVRVILIGKIYFSDGSHSGVS